MEIGKWKMAQAWRHFKRPASSKGMWKEFVKDQARIYEPIPSFVVPEFDELSPKEEQYYQQGPFSTDEVFLGSKGGVPQLVQPGPGRQGYQGVPGRTEFSKYDRYKNDPHTKANKIRTYLRSLKKGASIDTAKLMDKFEAEIGQIKKYLDEAEFLKKDFKITHGKKMAYAEARTGTPRNTIILTPPEAKHLEHLYSSKYKKLKGMKLVNAMYAAGDGPKVWTLLDNLRSGKHQGGIRDKATKRSAILEVYNKIKKQQKRSPHTVEIYKKLVGKFPDIRINYIREMLVEEGLNYTKWKPLIHGSKAEKLREMKRLRLERETKFSDPFLEAETRGRQGLRIPKLKIGPWEFKGMNIGGIHKHHMNSLRQNVNLRNIAYISGSDNWWLGKKIEGELGKIYAERETLLKEKSKGWKEKTNTLNDKGRKILDKVPERLKGLINFEVVEVNPKGTLKTSNVGMDWKVSAGAKAGEFGKMDFNKMNASQRKKAIKLIHQSYDDYRSARFTRSGAAGTLGGVGIGLGAVAAGAEYQQGKPLYDVFANLPLEFASFGMIPATEISQQLRIRGDLKDKGLSFPERNKKMALYNRLQAQEAIEQDVGDVGLESYALSGLGEGETKEQAYAVREDEDRELMERKINRGYNPETEKWEDRDPIAFEEAPYAEGGTVPRTGYKTAGLATKALRVLPWLLGPIDVILEAGMALPALAKGNPRMAKRSTTPGVFGSYGGTMLEDIRKYNRGAYRYAKATKDVNEWNALQEDIEIAEKIIASGEPSQGYEVLRAKQTLAEAKKKQALLEKNFSPTKDDDFQAFQDTMTQMAKDSREWSGDKNWLGQERGKQSTQESLEVAGVKPIDAHMMMKNADTTDEWRKRHQLEELDYELGGLNVETFLDPYGLKTQDPRYSDLPTDIASDYGSWEANQTRQKLEQLQNIDPGVAYAQGGIVSLLKK